MIAYIIRKTNRLGVRFALLMAVMIPMACMGLAGFCFATENDCELLLSKEAFNTNTLGEVKIRKIQENLAVTGYDPSKIDGKMGPNTRAALKRFCVEFEKELRKDSVDELMATLFHYTAISKVYPQWKDIVLSDGFKLWIDSQRPAQSAEMLKIRKSGTPRQIISLL